ncbi:GGDEF domain-containing protein [Psychromonas hadalis]|uniref:GGDEF domain-containing protein n=1 Tax=Psychromonas hadalis TaxID=211669 RepID=UPI0003B4D1FD|nr:GGDEF domain-containing protein [Psychromonas hadalis]
MKAKFKDRLSVKVVLLTLLMAAMTLLSSVVGIISLSEFRDEYQQVKDHNFDLLLKMTELKAQTDEVIHISTQMLLSGNINELQWNLLEVSDKRLWIDKLFNQLTGHTDDHQELLILKLRLYSHLDEIARAVTKKFKFSEQFFKLYGFAEGLKKASLKRDDIAFYIILDNAISHFNPIVNKQLELNKEADIEALESYINKISLKLEDDELQYLQDTFLGKNSLSVSYQHYARQLDRLEELRLKNEAFTDLFVSSLGVNVTRLQDRFIEKLARLESDLNKRKQRLYLVVFSCLFVTLFLLLIQLDFIRRIELIRRIINAGDSDRIMNFSITGKDEISKMAYSVQNYIERLVKKEQEVLTISKQLEHIASRDGLTGISNRRYFETVLTQENTRYVRYKEVYCVAMIDLDMFKNVNDNYGHDAGDKVLIEFTKRVLLIIRKTDQFARFGGEEFVLLMPNTIEKNAHMLMERIRLVIAEKPYLYNGEEIPFSVSIGLTEVQFLQGDDALKQLSFADRALYEAKHAGRNRVCVYKS